jgi:hypothetical protein
MLLQTSLAGKISSKVPNNIPRAFAWLPLSKTMSGKIRSSYNEKI